MATAFPNVEVIGMDLSKSNPEFTPSNCSFATGDITQDLPQYMDRFDLVHCRNVAWHLADPVALLKTIGKCLKQGGLCIVADGNYGLRNEKKEPLQPAEEGTDNTGRSWFARWMSEIGSRAVKIDQKMTFGEQLLHWLQDDNHFEKQDGKAYFSPVNWAGEGVENGHEVGQLMATNVNHIIEASRPLFLAIGLTNNDVDTWVRNIHDELDGPRVRIYFKWNVVWALKAGSS